MLRTGAATTTSRTEAIAPLKATVSSPMRLDTVASGAVSWSMPCCNGAAGAAASQALMRAAWLPISASARASRALSD